VGVEHVPGRRLGVRLQNQYLAEACLADQDIEPALVKKMDEVDVGHCRMGGRARYLKSLAFYDRRFARRLFVLHKRQFFRGAVLVIEGDALLRGKVDLQLRVAEEIVSLLDLATPGMTGERIRRRVRVTGCPTELMHLLGGRLLMLNGVTKRV